MANYNGNTFQYVPKKKWKKINNAFLDVIRIFQKQLKKDYKITFEFFLVGSAKKRLVTQDNNNKGFDFDYQILLHKGKDFNPENLHKWFFAAIRKAIIDAKKLQYKHPEEKFQAFTIKQLDENDNSIDHSFDFVIIRKNKELQEDTYEILYHDKTQKRDYWEIRSEMHKYEVKRNYIVKEKQAWQFVKDEYLKLKNANMDEKKKSFSLYHEAINNVYHQLTKKQI